MKQTEWKFLLNLTRKVLDQAFLSDEKFFKSPGLLNRQNDCFYAPKNNVKKVANPETRKTSLLKYFTVSAGVFKLGKTFLLVTEPNAKVKSAHYRGNIL